MSVSRRPSGVPTGGQFATGDRLESIEPELGSPAYDECEREDGLKAWATEHPMVVDPQDLERGHLDDRVGAYSSHAE